MVNNRITIKKRQSYLDKFCKVVTRELDDRELVAVSSLNDALICMADSMQDILRGNKVLDRLVRYGITDVYTTTLNANYGFAPEHNRWWGWSADDAQFYEIGSKVTENDEAYVPSCKEDFELRALKFWTHRLYEQTTIENKDEKGFDVVCKWSSDPLICPNVNARGAVTSHHYFYPKEYGHGAWTAETMDDVRQMAMDFAKNQLR